MNPSAHGRTSTTAFDNITWVHSFELIQIITDTEIRLATSTARPIGWYDDGQGNIADVCLTSAQATVAGYAVAKGWSQTLNQCIASLSTALPVCDGSNTRCRECSAADDNQASGCTGSKPVCETDETNQAFGECVACAISAQCSGTTPVCTKADAGNDTCRACASDAECTGNAAGPRCLPTGACGPAPTPDAGSGSGPGSTSSGSGTSSGCSASGSSPAAELLGLVLLALLLGRRRAPVR